MKRLLACIVVIAMLSACCGCSGPSQPAGSGQPATAPGPSGEAPESAPASGAAPEPQNRDAARSPALPDAGDDQPSPESPPDPGTGDLLPVSGEEDPQRARVEAMAAYLKEHLDPRDYTEIWFDVGAEGSRIEIITPTPEAAEAVVAAYTGEAVPVEYLHADFSKGQLTRAREDLESFLAAHPEVDVTGWAPILLFDGFRITLTAESDTMTDFVGTYPVAGIYQLAIASEGSALHPD